MNRTMRLYNFMKEFWLLVKKYVDVPDNKEDAAWMQIIDEAEDLNKKYKGDDAEGQFVKDCIVAWMAYLNRRNKENMGRSIND